MSNETKREPLWTDENIMDDARRATSNPTAQAQIRNCLLFMRHGYEADRAALHERIAALTAELEAAREWQPAPDGMYEYPNWNGKGTVIIRILNDGAELEQWHNSLPDDIEEISLSSDYRLYQRKREGAA